MRVAASSSAPAAGSFVAPVSTRRARDRYANAARDRRRPGRGSDASFTPSDCDRRAREATRCRAIAEPPGSAEDSVSARVSTTTMRVEQPSKTRTRGDVDDRGAKEAKTRSSARASSSSSSFGCGDGETPVTDAQRRASARSAMPLRYDPTESAKRFTRDPARVAARAAEITATLSSFAASVAMDYQRGQVEENSRVRAGELREKLTRLGPAFVKVGQALSTRPDLLPTQYLEELSSLQDALPTFQDADAFALVEKELGRPLESMFERITPEPVAAASLGQVYKAVTKEGRDVALKVQRPSIEAGLDLDFFLIRSGATVIDKIVTSLNTSIVDLVDEFATRVFLELDYVQEGRNAERFARLYGDRPDIVVPGIEWEYTSPRVITMEWIQGTKLSDQESLKAQGLDVLALVDSGIQCSLRQLLEFGYFHADPHPGNLLATPDGKLAFLDFGMMSEMPESARYAIIDHVVHLVNRDYVAMANDYYALEFLDRSVDVTPIVPALEEFFDDVLDATVEELNFKTITDGLGAVLYKYPFNVPGYYALILRSLTVLEGLALTTDPKFKVLAKAYPYMARRLLTDPRPQLRDSFAELLFKDGSFRWNRLENLLREGRKSDDYDAAAVVPPLIELAIGADKPGEAKNNLRPLIEAETVKVLEAILLGSAMDSAKSDALAPIVNALPEQLKALPPLTMGSASQEAKLLKKREEVLRIVELYSSSKGFDPQALRPFTDAFQQPSASVFVQHVAAGLAERIAARVVNVFLLSQEASAAVKQPTPSSKSTNPGSNESEPNDSASASAASAR